MDPMGVEKNNTLPENEETYPTWNGKPEHHHPIEKWGELRGDMGTGYQEDR